jgi:F-type H+-transporting ATPase subunit b
MDATLHALGEILLKAIPTFLLVIVLHYYLKYVYFRPLEKVLDQRYAVTEGARKMADEALRRAAAKTAEYEAAIRAARAEVYQAQEQLHKQLQERAAAEMALARQSADEMIRTAKNQLAQDVEASKATLASESDALANQIADSLLRSAA